MREALIINGNYAINENGEIRRVTAQRGTFIGKKIKPQLDTKGYHRVRLTDGDKAMTLKVHRLVAKSFIPNPDNLPQVNHKDTIKTNNNFLNLEWCNNADNANHAKDNGLIKKPFKGKFGKDHNKSIPITATNIDTGEKKLFYGTYEAARELKTNIGSIHRVRKGIYKHTKRWSFERL